MYGTEDDRRYPGLQAEFFQRAAAPLRRREAVLGFVGIGKAVFSLSANRCACLCFLDVKNSGSLGWAAGILLWGANGSKWAKLPIQNGPKKGAVIGPRGHI